MQLHQALFLLTTNDLKARRKLTPITDRSQRKADMVAALAEYLLSGDLDAIWEQLSELDLDAIAEAVHCWDGGFDAVRFRAKYRALPSHFKRHTYSFRQ